MSTYAHHFSLALYIGFLNASKPYDASFVGRVL